ncbi:hypothetical protein WR25_20877 [Diploscapter pachys]|uniref:Uncharacterized protein n=1 Tax=Diploscapter pachys TaxID=2018661 RepID=A0A2A2JPN0_9BILA|nr:hypothetical protein WR25_20877 [Diploscapter pachys]
MGANAVRSVGNLRRILAHFASKTTPFWVFILNLNHMIIYKRNGSEYKIMPFKKGVQKFTVEKLRTKTLKIAELTIFMRLSLIRTSWSDSLYSHAGSRRQFLLDRQPADIEYNSCYLQSKTLSSYNHKAAQVLSAIKNATKNGTKYESSSASLI